MDWWSRSERARELEVLFGGMVKMVVGEGGRELAVGFEIA